MKRALTFNPMTEEEVVNYVKENLASYNNPRHVRFLGALPCTAATVKVQRAEIRKNLAGELAF